MDNKDNVGHQVTDFLFGVLVGWPLTLAVRSKRKWERVGWFVVFMVWVVPMTVMMAMPLMLAMLTGIMLDVVRGE